MVCGDLSNKQKPGSCKMQLRWNFCWTQIQEVINKNYLRLSPVMCACFFAMIFPPIHWLWNILWFVTKQLLDLTWHGFGEIICSLLRKEKKTVKIELLHECWACRTSIQILHLEEWKKLCGHSQIWTDGHTGETWRLPIPQLCSCFLQEKQNVQCQFKKVQVLDPDVYPIRGHSGS